MFCPKRLELEELGLGFVKRLAWKGTFATFMYLTRKLSNLQL